MHFFPPECVRLEAPLCRRRSRSSDQSVHLSTFETHPSSVLERAMEIDTTEESKRSYVDPSETSRSKSSRLQEVPVATKTQPGIRKTAFGRTDLFIPREDVFLREFQSHGRVRRVDTTSVYHSLPPAYTSDGRSDGSMCCWHCCDMLDNTKTIFPIPRHFDVTTKTYHVFGATCSPGCTKAYILEHSSFDRGHVLNTFSRMLSSVYGINDEIVETPPRPALKRFGGYLDANRANPALCTVVEPPFVSYCMIVEEQRDMNALPSAESLKTSEVTKNVEDTSHVSSHSDEPGTDGDSLYKDFLERVALEESSRPAPENHGTKRPVNPSPSEGSLSKFVRTK